MKQQHQTRLTRAQQGHILRQMVTLARMLTLEGVPAPRISHALARLRDDLVAALRAGLTVVSVDWETYLAPYRGRAQPGVVTDADLQATWEGLQAIPSYVEQRAAAFAAEQAQISDEQAARQQGIVSGEEEEQTTP